MRTKRPSRRRTHTPGRLLAVGAALLALAAWTGTARGHEPIFGIGPHTIHKYGVGVEAEIEAGEDDRATTIEAIYGVTEDLALTVSLPRDSRPESGWGTPMIRSKWRFYRNDGPGGSNQAAIAFGVRTPAIDLGPSGPGFLFAVTAGREARREYAFAGLRYLLNTKDGDGFKPGDVFKYDLALGIRPVPAGYDDPDLVVLLELNGLYRRKPTIPGAPNVASAPGVPALAGSRIAFGPGMIFSYRNIMLKAGVDFVVMNGSDGIPFGDEIESVVAIESHLSPFSFLYGR